MIKQGSVILFTVEECDILYDALGALRHRDLCIMTDYGTKAINGKEASRQLDRIDRLRKAIWPETSAGRWQRGKRENDHRRGF